ncbi:MAG: Gfo/Idh/MocA family protein [Planctomycetota bacterium]
MPGEDGTTRRRFLETMATGAVAPYVLHSSVLAATPPSDRITMGLIGVGKMCWGHLGAMLGRRQVRVLAVAEVDAVKRERARKRADDHYARQGASKGIDAYNDFRELLNRSDIDAVLNATPDHWHAIVCIRAAQAGKDIYSEKPFSLTLGEARAMVEAAERYRVVFQTGSQQRSDRRFRFACEMVRSGRVGKLHTVHVNVGGPSVPCRLPGQPVRKGVDWDLWLGPAPWRPFHETICPPYTFKGWPQWRRFRDYSGGSMTDMGHHHFDIAQWGMGTERTGPVKILPPNGKDVEMLTYKYANGVTLHHTGGAASIHFKGTDGEVMVGRGYLRTDPPDMMHTPIGPHEVHLYNSPNHHNNWLECIRTRRPPIAEAEIGCRSVSICHLGNLAYWLKRPLRWDPDREVFRGDAEANRWLDRPKRAPWRL